MPNARKVSSSNIDKIGYNEKTETLSVHFAGSRTYQYSGVPKRLYDDFMEAGSKGKFLHSRIAGKYPHSLV